MSKIRRIFQILNSKRKKEGDNLTKEQRELLSLQNQDYSHLPLIATSEEASKKVETILASILRESGSQLHPNYYSNATRREVVYTLQTVVEELSRNFGRIDYLEIGSALGASMALVALLLKGQSLLGKLVSIDPYFKDGYIEGARGPWKKENLVTIDEKSMEIAKSLYAELSLDVELMRDFSFEALTNIVKRGDKFHLIYIDGSHEGLNPLIDFALCTRLVEPTGGIIMFDDHHWPDVKKIKEICDEHLPKVHESWKIAAYKWINPSILPIIQVKDENT